MVLDIINNNNDNNNNNSNNCHNHLIFYQNFHHSHCSCPFFLFGTSVFYRTEILRYSSTNEENSLIYVLPLEGVVDY